MPNAQATCVLEEATHLEHEPLVQPAKSLRRWRIIKGGTCAQKIHAQVGVCHGFLPIQVVLPALHDLCIFAWHLGAQKVHEIVIPVLGQPYAAKQVPHVVIRLTEASGLSPGQLLQDGLHTSNA